MTTIAPEKTKTSDDLDKAADLIEELGWAREPHWEAFERGEALCVGLAIATVTDSKGGMYEYTEPMTALASVIGVRGAAYVPRWNDRDCSGQEEAVAVLREAAERMRRAGK